MLLLLMTLTAGAQEPERDGVRAGGATVSPSLGVGTSFTPNLFRAKTNPLPAQALLLRPGIDVTWETPYANWDLGATATRRQVLYLVGAPGLNAWQTSRTSIGLNTQLVVGPRSRIQFVVREQFSRNDRTAPSGISSADGRSVTVRNHNSAGAAIRVVPGGGALVIDVGGGVDVDNVNVSDAPDFLVPTTTRTRLAGGPDLEARWSFFPRTDLVLKGHVHWYAWASLPVSTNLLPGMDWRVQAGLIGRVDRPLVLNVLAGYGQLRDGNVAPLNPLDGLLVNASVRWQPRTGHHLTLGYVKDQADSWFATSLATNRGFAAYDADLSRRLHMRVEGGVALEFYRGNNAYTDVVGMGTLSARYDITKQLDLGVSAGVWNRAQAGWDVPIEATLNLHF